MLLNSAFGRHYPSDQGQVILRGGGVGPRDYKLRFPNALARLTVVASR